ncbi:MAG: hypothetical protein MJY44_02765 [Bacteroidales bacterium]|nr:hypothetical protein [Bacteroidales bacterium]
MGFYENVRAKPLLIAHDTAKEFVERIPLLHGNEKYLSDIDLFLTVTKSFKDGEIENVTIIGSHLEFVFRSVRFAIFNGASLYSSVGTKLSLTGQGLLDIKGHEINEWHLKHPGEMFATVVFEMGSSKQIEVSEANFAMPAHDTDDFRYSIKCGFAKVNNKVKLKMLISRIKFVK